MPGRRERRGTPRELQALPGFPFAYPGALVHLSGPTGRGKSAIAEAGAVDAAIAGLRVLYVSFEIAADEFNARATLITLARDLDDQARQRLPQHLTFANGYLLLPLVKQLPRAWPAATRALFDVIVIDPAGYAANSLGLNDQDNADWARFHGLILAPLQGHTAALVLDNIGHATEAKTRSMGASRKDGMS